MSSLPVRYVALDDTPVSSTATVTELFEFFSSAPRSSAPIDLGTLDMLSRISSYISSECDSSCV